MIFLAMYIGGMIATFLFNTGLNDSEDQEGINMPMPTILLLALFWLPYLILVNANIKTK